MFAGLKQLFSPSNKDLRKRIYFTLMCLGLFCLGTTITIPWASALYQELGFLEIFNLYKAWRKNVLKQFNSYNLISRNDEYFKYLFNLKYTNFKNKTFIFK